MIHCTREAASRAGWVQWAPVCAALGALAGCAGSDGPPRYPLSGTATYQGEPVAAGVMLLEPDP